MQFITDEIPSALIGAVIGSAGATFLSNWLSFRKNRKLLQEQRTIAESSLSSDIRLQKEKTIRTFDRAIVALRIAMNR